MQRIEMWASRMPLLWGAMTGWIAVLFLVMGWLDSTSKAIIALLIWSEAVILSWRAANQSLVLADDHLIYQAMFLRYEIPYHEIRSLNIAAIAGITNYEFWLYVDDGSKSHKRICLQIFGSDGRQEFFDALCAHAPRATLGIGARTIRDRGFAWYP